MSLGKSRLAQVAILVHDIEKAKADYAEVLGAQFGGTMTTDGYDAAATHFEGKPTDAKAKLAFADLENVQLELIQPLGGNSTWQKALDERGEGVHHVAFWVEGLDSVVSEFEAKGCGVEQVGKMGGGNGAYVYIDAQGPLKLTLELLSKDDAPGRLIPG